MFTVFTKTLKKVFPTKVSMRWLPQSDDDDDDDADDYDDYDDYNDYDN